MIKALAIAVLFVGMHEQTDFSELNAAMNWQYDVRYTSWCAAFVGMVLKRSGLPHMESYAARSYLKWGKAVTKPQKGDLVIFSRGNSGWQGHVGFFIRQEGDAILVLGGNQSDQVSYKWYRADRVLGFRRNK